MSVCVCVCAVCVVQGPTKGRKTTSKRTKGGLPGGEIGGFQGCGFQGLRFGRDARRVHANPKPVRVHGRVHAKKIGRFQGFGFGRKEVPGFGRVHAYPNTIAPEHRSETT
jgi:hypothetical protein